MIQDDVVNTLRKAQDQTVLSIQGTPQQKRGLLYTIILEDGKDTVKDVKLPGVFELGDTVQDIETGFSGKVVRKELVTKRKKK